MALSNYTEIKTAVAEWLDRSDLTANIPDFISLAEARINRDLRVRSMETRAKLSTVAGKKYYNLPPGYLQMRNIQLNTNPTTPMEFISLEMLDRLYGSDAQGKPTAYSIVGDELQISPLPDGVYDLEVAYYKKFDSLSSTLTSNWLTRNAPDLLLYGSLLEAEPFLKNDERTQLWLAGYESAVRKLTSADDRDRHSGSTMRVRNIYSGVA
ncbi:MAG: hypothetical protein NZ811_03660 [Gammaproteobacteria bacterium]|nr:hypothetical protein [Gammaproteobacteria bacterium]